jgi:hypothetical protein
VRYEPPTPPTPPCGTFRNKFDAPLLRVSCPFSIVRVYFSNKYTSRARSVRPDVHIVAEHHWYMSGASSPSTMILAQSRETATAHVRGRIVGWEVAARATQEHFGRRREVGSAVRIQDAGRRHLQTRGAVAAAKANRENNGKGPRQLRHAAHSRSPAWSRAAWAAAS